MIIIAEALTTAKMTNRHAMFEFLLPTCSLELIDRWENNDEFSARGHPSV